MREHGLMLPHSWFRLAGVRSNDLSYVELEFRHTARRPAAFWVLSGSSVQHLADPVGQLGDRPRLVEEREAGVEGGVLSYVSRRVAAREEKGNLFPLSPQALVQRAAAESRHHHVGEDERHVSLVGVEDAQRLFAVLGEEDAIAEPLEHPLGGPADRLLIVGDEDRLAAAGRRGKRRRGGALRCRRGGRGEVKLDRRALAQLA